MSGRSYKSYLNPSRILDFVGVSSFFFFGGGGRGGGMKNNNKMKDENEGSYFYVPGAW